MKMNILILTYIMYILFNIISGSWLPFNMDGDKVLSIFINVCERIKPQILTDDGEIRTKYNEKEMKNNTNEKPGLKQLNNKELKKLLHSQTQSQSQSLSQSRRGSNNIPHFNDLFTQNKKNNINIMQPYLTELNMYKNEIFPWTHASIKQRVSENPMIFYDNNLFKSKYVFIRFVVMYLIVIMPSSSQSESVFSRCGHLVSKRRSRMGAQQIGRIIETKSKKLCINIMENIPDKWID